MHLTSTRTKPPSLQGHLSAQDDRNALRHVVQRVLPSRLTCLAGLANHLTDVSKHWEASKRPTSTRQAVKPAFVSIMLTVEFGRHSLNLRKLDLSLAAGSHHFSPMMSVYNYRRLESKALSQLHVWTGRADQHSSFALIALHCRRSLRNGSFTQPRSTNNFFKLSTERSFEAELFKGAPQSSQLQPKVPHASRRHVLGAHQTVRVARHDSGHRLAEAGEAADLRSNGKRCT